MRVPLLTKNEKRKHLRCAVFFAFFLVTALIYVLNDHTKTVSESVIGADVSSQLVTTCVDVGNTCIANWLTTQHWEDAIVDPGTPPQLPRVAPQKKIKKDNCCTLIKGIKQCIKDCFGRRTNELDLGMEMEEPSEYLSGLEFNSFPGVHFVPPICDKSIRIDESLCFEQNVFTQGDRVGRGGLGVVYDVSIKAQHTPRFWNPSIPGVLKFASRNLWSIQSIGQVFREALLSIAVKQRFDILDPTMSKHIAYAVDVFDGKNIAMQPKAMDTLESEYQKQKYIGNLGHSKFIAKQMLHIIDKLHFVAGIAHFDIKLSNWLVDEDPSTTRLILTDWGCAVPLQKDGSAPFNKYITGTIAYDAPEHLILMNTSPMVKNGKLTTKADLWQIGMSIYKLYFGQYLLYPNIRDTDENSADALGYLMYEYAEPSFPEGIPCDAICKDFFKRILHRDPTQRLSSQAAMNHPWLSNGLVDPPNIPPPREAFSSIFSITNEDSGASSASSASSVDSQAPLIPYTLASPDAIASPTIPRLNLPNPGSNSQSVKGSPEIPKLKLTPQGSRAASALGSDSSWEIMKSDGSSPTISNVAMPNMQGSHAASPNGISDFGGPTSARLTELDQTQRSPMGSGSSQSPSAETPLMPK